MKHTIKTVALVEWNWTGHHPTYFISFAAALAELHVSVAPFCPSLDSFHRLQQSLEIPTEELSYLHPASPYSLPRRWRIRPYRFQPVVDIVNTVRHFRDLAIKLREWEAENNQKIDLVFFPCIKDDQFRWFRYAERFFRFPWAGLYLNCRAFRVPRHMRHRSEPLTCPEAIFASSSLHSLAILDHAALQQVQSIVGHRPVVCFPDICDRTIPAPSDPEGGLSRKLLAFANGRRIVSLVGYLQRSKGVDEFVRASQFSAMKEVVFFLGGETNWRELSNIPGIERNNSFEQSQNLCFHPNSLAEPALNAILSISDVIFAAYTDFPHSSNILSKAAYLDKPVIVSDGYIMAERTREFGLGEVVIEKNVDQIVDSIRRILSSEYATNRSCCCQRNEYMRCHSQDSLVRSFAEILSISR